MSRGSNITNSAGSGLGRGLLSSLLIAAGVVLLILSSAFFLGESSTSAGGQAAAAAVTAPVTAGGTTAPIDADAPETFDLRLARNEISTFLPSFLAFISPASEPIPLASEAAPPAAPAAAGALSGGAERGDAFDAGAYASQPPTPVLEAPAPVAPPPTAAPPPPPVPTPVPPAPPPTATPLPPPPPPPAATLTAFEADILAGVNGQRLAAGLPALQLDGRLVTVARERSNDMAVNNYFAHTSPTGETAFSIMDRYGIPYGWAGENLARNNYPDSEAVAVALQDWMASQGHRDNILSPHYSLIGVGAAVDASGMKYFTLVFVGY